MVEVRGTAYAQSMSLEATLGPALVVGYDGSDFARAALLYAARRCAAGGRIIVACAHPEAPSDLAHSARDALNAQHAADAKSILDALALDAPPELEEVTWSSETLAGAPAEALIALAAREDADEIVVGTHGRGRVSALLGSVAHDLLRLADRPVAVIPPRAVAPLLPGSAEARA